MRFLRVPTAGGAVLLLFQHQQLPLASSCSSKRSDESIAAEQQDYSTNAMMLRATAPARCQFVCDQTYAEKQEADAPKDLTQQQQSTSIRPRQPVEKDAANHSGTL
ncbi:hypothetical protein cyc_00410 [Cyclospora cayetanensis]|uniref:Uncharacterized protein n=1 Tax=Cyclospora cayetanensis TaxID=88456 RepID=A0A1D3CTV6_9EIME|nr:hypothetical protein cyc_00410 [Cyclospora cayetanensis]